MIEEEFLYCVRLFKTYPEKTIRFVMRVFLYLNYIITTFTILLLRLLLFFVR